MLDRRTASVGGAAMSTRDLAAQPSSCHPRGGVPRRHQRGAFKGAPDGARHRNCTRRCNGGDTNSGSRNRFKFSSWARDDREGGGGSHSSPQWQSPAAPAPLATERVPDEVMRPRSVPAIEMEEAVVNPWSTGHARENVPRLDVNESGSLEDARGARVAREEALVDFDAVSIPEERGVQMGIIRDDVDRRSSKVMRLIDKIRTFPHGMDVGIALQPAVLGDNESMRLPPREILEAAEEHLGDLRALEIWSWIERQVGGFHVLCRQFRIDLYHTHAVVLIQRQRPSFLPPPHASSTSRGSTTIKNQCRSS